MLMLGDILIIHITSFDLFILCFITKWNMMCIPKCYKHLISHYLNFDICIFANKETLNQTVVNPDKLFFTWGYIALWMNEVTNNSISPYCTIFLKTVLKLVCLPQQMLWYFLYFLRCLEKKIKANIMLRVKENFPIGILEPAVYIRVLWLVLSVCKRSLLSNNPLSGCFIISTQCMWLL